MVRTQHKAGVSGRFRHGYLITLSSETGKKFPSAPLGSSKQELLCWAKAGTKERGVVMDQETKQRNFYY